MLERTLESPLDCKEIQPVSGAHASVQAKGTILYLGGGALVPTKELRVIAMYIIYYVYIIIYYVCVIF